MSNAIGAASIELSVDASGVESGLNRADAAVTRTGRTIQGLGTRSSQTFEGMGQSSTQGAGRVDAATRSLIGSIQRATAAMEGGSRASRAYFETRASQLGVDASKLQSYLDQLDAVTARQNNAGISAGQMRAALRGVPAQVTDIVTALQGGQAPLTVFLQQGGQLRDQFGSIGAAARGLGSHLLGLINPYTVVAAATVALALAYNQGSKEADAYNRALITTGNQAATTAGQMADMARNISATTGTQGAAAEALAALASTGRVGASNLQQFGDIALRTQKTVGVSVQDLAKDFGDLAKSPLQATERLNEQYNYLTGAIYQQIKALEEQGKTSEAAEVAQQAYASAMDERSKGIKANLGLIEGAWKSVGDRAKQAWDWMLNVGRADTLQQQLESVQAKIKAAQPKIYSFIDGPAAKRELEDLRTKESLLQSQIREQNLANEAKDRANKLEAARIEWARQGEAIPKTRTQQLKEEIDRARTLGERTKAPGEDPAAVEQRIAERVAEIRKKYADLFNEGVDAQIEAIKRRGAVEDEVARRSLDLVNAKRNSGQIDDADFIRATADLEQASFVKQKERLTEELALTTRKQNSLKEQATLRGQLATLEQAAVTAQLRAQSDLNTLEVKRERSAADAYADAVDRQMAERDSTRQQLIAQQDYNEQIGLSKEGITELVAARLDDQAAQKMQLAALFESIDVTGRQSELYREQAANLRALAQAKREGAQKDAVAEAIKETVEASKRGAQQIEDALTNALMRGFERGKSFAENLRDTTINMFKSLVLQPTIQGVVTGAMGGGASASSPLGALQAATQLGSLYSAFAGLGGTVTTLGNIFGASAVSAFGAGLSGGAGVAEAIAAYNAAGMTSVGSAMSAGASLSTGISSAIAAIPGWGWAAMGAAALASAFGIFGDGPEKDTRLTFTSNNTPGNISINERGNEGRSGQSYIDGFGTGAFGTFGLSSTFWMDGRQDAVQGFIQTVAKVDDALAGFLTTTERERVKAAVTGATFTAHTGAEGDNPNARGQLDKVFADRMKVVLDGVSPGLAKLIDGFKGTSQELATEAAAILQFRKALQDGGEALFGAQVTLEQIAALKSPTEATSAALNRVTAEFSATNAVATALGKTSLEAFGAAGLASLDARENLIKFAGGVDALNQNTAVFAQNFLTPMERAAPMVEQLNKQLAALGYNSITSKEQFKDLLQGIDVNTEDGAKRAAQLLALAGPFSVVTELAEAAAKKTEDLNAQLYDLTHTDIEVLARKRQLELAALSATDAELQKRIYQLQDEKAAIEATKQAAADLLGSVDGAYSTLQDIVNRQRTALQEAHEADMKAIEASITAQNNAVTKYQALSNSLRATLDQMQLPGQEAFTRQQAQAEIRAALAIARAGGPLPDSEQLQRALSVVTQNAANQFGSYTDYLRDLYTTSNDISALEGISDSSLSVAQKTLKALEGQKASLEAGYERELGALDDILEQSQDEINVLKGMDTKLLTIADGLAALAQAIASASKNPVVASNALTAAYRNALGRDPDAAGLAWYMQQAAGGASIGDLTSSIENSREAQIRKLYRQILERNPDSAGMEYWVSSGATLQQIREALMNSDEYRKHLRGFAIGTNFVPYTMPALIHEGERIIPAADNRRLEQRLAAPAVESAHLVSAVARLETVMARVEVITERVATNTGNLAELIDNLSEGGNILRVEMA